MGDGWARVRGARVRGRSIIRCLLFYSVHGGNCPNIQVIVLYGQLFMGINVPWGIGLTG